MKNVFVILFILTLFSCSSGKVNISGTALDHRNSGGVSIFLNDTLRKIQKTKDFVDKPLFDNKKIFFRSDQFGNFHVKVKRSDSLYFMSFHSKPKYISVADLLKMDKIKIVLEKEPCEEFIICEEENPELQIIIGKKITLKYAPYRNYCNIISLDNKFDAEYMIIKNIEGSYNEETIQFTVYDHYGRPSFEDYEYVLLYLTKRCGEYIHIKYQYSPLYKTQEGKWASPYYYHNYKNNETSIVPEKIDFKDNLIILNKANSDPEWMKKNYPVPYYEIKGDTIIPLYGNYVEQLIQLKKTSVLKDL